MASARKPRRGRLSRSADFDKVMRSGRSQAGREFVVYVFPRGGDEPPRLGVSVSRRVGGAVDRNLVKRLIRETFAREQASFEPGTDVVVIARVGARSLAEDGGFEALYQNLVPLFRAAQGRPAAVADGEPRKPTPTTAEQLSTDPAWGVR